MVFALLKIVLAASDDFEKLFRLIEAANTILSNANSK